MRQRPIIFGPDSVRAILAGRKTQTRRLVKGANIITCDDLRGATDTQCPYGSAGDRLWVRETWRPHWTEELGACICYRDGSLWKPKGLDEHTGHRFMDMIGDYDEENPSPWKSPIHMPRWASRITLDVVSIRVERLQSISEADAAAEGVQTHAQYYGIPEEKLHGSTPWYRYDGQPCAVVSAVESYRTLWDSINGKTCPWSSNPWVWVIEFGRHTDLGRVTHALIETPTCKNCGGTAWTTEAGNDHQRWCDDCGADFDKEPAQ